MKKNLTLLFALVILASALITACGAPATASNDNPNTEQTLNSDVPTLTPDYYIKAANGQRMYEVVTFTDRFGRDCTSVLSIFTDAGPALFCQ
jgi:hypothetical protein